MHDHSKLRNVTGSKLRAIHRTQKRHGATTASLRGYARTLYAMDCGPLDWMAAEAAAFMRRKGMRP